MLIGVAVPISYFASTRVAIIFVNRSPLVSAQPSSHHGMQNANVKIRSCFLLLLPLSFSHLFSSITSLRFIACSISNRNRTNVNAGEGCNSEIRCNPTRGVRSEIVPLDKEMRDVMSARVTLKLKSTCSNEILARRVGLAVTVSRYFVPCPLVTCTLYRILAVFCCSITRKAVL